MHNKENQVKSNETVAPSKNQTPKKVVEESVPKGKTIEELKEIAQTLQAQKNEHQEKAKEAQTLMNQELTIVTKAQGALEVILQMIPREEVEKMIKEEENDS